MHQQVTTQMVTSSCNLYLNIKKTHLNTTCYLTTTVAYQPVWRTMSNVWFADEECSDLFLCTCYPWDLISISYVFHVFNQTQTNSVLTATATSQHLASYTLVKCIYKKLYTGTTPV